MIYVPKWQFWRQLFPKLQQMIIMHGYYDLLLSSCFDLFIFHEELPWNSQDPDETEWKASLTFADSQWLCIFTQVISSISDASIKRNVIKGNLHNVHQITSSMHKSNPVWQLKLIASTWYEKWAMMNLVGLSCICISRWSWWVCAYTQSCQSWLFWK